MKQIDEDIAGVETALTCRADHTGEDLLGGSTTVRAIAAADLSIHHGRTERLLGARQLNAERIVTQS